MPHKKLTEKILNQQLASRAQTIYVITLLISCLLLIVTTIFVCIQIVNCDSRNNLPLYIFLFIGSAILSSIIAIVLNIYMRKLIFIPLEKLAQSVSESATNTENPAIYGVERNDDLGVLARTVQYLCGSLNESNLGIIQLMQERERQEFLLETINEVTFALLGMPDGNMDQFNASLMRGLSTVSVCGDVDAIIVFRNDENIESKSYITQLFWDDGIPLIVDQTDKRYSYDSTPGWYDIFSELNIINATVAGMSPIEQSFIDNRTKSILIVPVYFQERFWGTVWYEDRKCEEPFDSKRVALLRSAALMIVSAVHRKRQAKRIRDASERMRVMLDAMPIGCHMWNKNLDLIDANNKGIKFFNLKDKKELAQRYNELSPEYQSNGRMSTEYFRENIKRAFNEGILQFDWVHRVPDTGELVPTEVTLIRMQFDGVSTVAGYLLDVREHHRMIKEIEHRGDLLHTVSSAATILLQSKMDDFESALFRSLSMMARIVDVERVCVWEYQAHDDRSHFTQIYEWVGDDDIFGRQNLNIHYYNDTTGFESRLLRGLCITGNSADLPPANREALLLKDTKSYLMIPVFLRGKLWGLICFGDMRKERKFSENDETILRSGGLLVANALLRYEMTQSIQATASRLQGVISNYTGIIWSVDSKDTITLFAGLALQKFGDISIIYEGKKLLEIPVEQDIFRIVEHVRKTFSAGAQQWTISLNEGIFTVRTAPVYDKRYNITDVVGSIVDVTEPTLLQERLEKALSDAQAASNAKSNFLSTMSHEMRTPMNAIIGMSAIGKATNAIARKDYAFEKIEGASNHLLGVINDVLDMSKIEAGMLTLSEETFELERAINKVITITNFRIEEKNQHFHYYIDPQVPKSIVADDHRLIQVLTNLVSNAIKFTPNNKFIRIEIKLIEKDDKLCTIQFNVIDQGIGLSKGQQGKLFQSFVQAEASTTRKYGGTGLGLAISKHIVDLMGGKIWIESELGMGATFSFTIIAKIPKGAEELIPSYMEDNNTPTFPGKVLLLAEDVDINREIVLATLEDTQITIDCAENGAEALTLFGNNPDRYDLIFMDVHMPIMDGYEATRGIRSLEYPRAKKVPIVAMTANVFREDIDKCLAAGMDAHLGKPLDFGAIFDTLKKYLYSYDE